MKIRPRLQAGLGIFKDGDTIPKNNLESGLRQLGLGFLLTGTPPILTIPAAGLSLNRLAPALVRAARDNIKNYPQQYGAANPDAPVFNVLQTARIIVN